MPALPRLSSFSRSPGQQDLHGGTQERRAHRSLSTGQAKPKDLSLRPVDSAPVVTMIEPEIWHGSPLTPSPLHSPHRPSTFQSMSTSNAAAYSPGLPSPPSSYRRSQILDSYGVRPRRLSGPPTPRDAVESLVDRPNDSKYKADDPLDDFRRQFEHLANQCRRESSVEDEAGYNNLVQRLVELRRYCTDWDKMLEFFEERAVAKALQEERSIGT